MKRALSVLFALILALALLPTAALADIGPKPSVTITVVNPPEGEYYLDLLIPEAERGDYDNLRGKEYDGSALSGLHSLEGEGWYPAYAGGTKAPLFGDLRPGADGKHRFTYFGLPDTFRIIVSQPGDGGCLIPCQATEIPFTRTEFSTELIYDFEANTLLRAAPAGPELPDHLAPVTGVYKTQEPVKATWELPVTLRPAETVASPLSGLIDHNALEELRLSPLGAVLVSSSPDYTQIGGYPLTVFLADGTSFHPGSGVHGHQKDGPNMARWVFDRPIEVNSITGVALGAWMIPVENGVAGEGYWLAAWPD